MRFPMTAVLLAACASERLAGCMGQHGNPDSQPYATEPGGAIAVKPQVDRHRKL